MTTGIHSSAMTAEHHHTFSDGTYLPINGRTAAKDSVVVDSLYQHLDLTVLLDKVSKRLNDSHAVDWLRFSSSVTPYNYLSDNIINCAGYYSTKCPLDYNGQGLGIISLFRRARFSSTEAYSIQQFLKGFCGPLRNALLYERAVHCAYHDSLTGAYNRAALNSRLFSEHSKFTRKRRSGRNQTVLIICDIDNFKSINDKLGHTVGDEVLRSFANSLRSIINNDTLLFRYGGDEFVLTVTNTTEALATKYAERIREYIDQCVVRVKDVEVNLTTTIGATLLDKYELPENAFIRADTALLRGKKKGKNRVIWCRHVNRVRSSSS